MLDQSDSNLKRSLGLVSTYTSVDEEMAVSFCYCTVYVDIYIYISIRFVNMVSAGQWPVHVWFFETAFCLWHVCVFSLEGTTTVAVYLKPNDWLTNFIAFQLHI